MALNLDLNPVSHVVDSIMAGSAGDWVLQVAVLLGGVFLEWARSRRTGRGGPCQIAR